MHIDAGTPTPTQLAELAAHQALAARHAIQTEAKATNARQVAALSAWADSGQQAEHIRGLVATTMAYLAPHASAATREDAAQWQAWALGLADGLDAAVAS